MARVEFKDIAVRYGTQTIIENLSLTLEDGQFTVLVGPSGCGKSTLLRIVAGLLQPSSGHISIDGEDITTKQPGARDIAMVFQSYALYPHMTVLENLAFPLRIRKLSEEKIAQQTKEVLQLLDIEALRDRYPKELSGGQRQRVAMGRAIVRRPKVFLFDEPLSNLDANLRVRMRGEILALHKRLGTTMLYVTHDQQEAMTLADKLVVLRRGHIEQEGRPLDIFFAPHNRFVGEFLGQPPMNFLPLDVETRQASLINLRWTLPHSYTPSRVWLGIRPEDIECTTSAQSASIEAVVRRIENTGSESFLYADINAHSLVIRVDPQRAPEHSTRVFLKFLKPHFFDWTDEHVVAHSS